MATLGYSSFFSSGLLAVETEPAASRTHTPDPSTPRSNYNTLDDTTPTAATHTIPAAAQAADEILPVLTQAIEINDSPPSQDRPRMRRRRSSLGLNASPVSTLKGNSTPRAAVPGHLQRQSMGVVGIVTPNRSRAGSVAEAGSFLSRAAMSIASNDATSGNSIVGRMRSGSVGTALRYVFQPVPLQSMLLC